MSKKVQVLLICLTICIAVAPLAFSETVTGYISCDVQTHQLMSGPNPLYYSQNDIIRFCLNVSTLDNCYPTWNRVGIAFRYTPNPFSSGGQAGYNIYKSDPFPQCESKQTINCLKWWENGCLYEVTVYDASNSSLASTSKRVGCPPEDTLTSVSFDSLPSEWGKFTLIILLIAISVLFLHRQLQISNK